MGGITKFNMIETNKLQDAVICREDDSVLEVSRILRDTKSRHLIVVDENKCPVGIISTVDINNRVVAQELEPKDALANEIMTSPIAVVEVNSNYEEAYKKMVEKGMYSIPVVENEKLIGILDFNHLFGKAKEILR